MNLNEPGWYGQINRESKTVNVNGTMGEVLVGISQYLIQAEIRAKSSGPRKMMIFIQDSPITQDQVEHTQKLIEVEAGLAQLPNSPQDFSNDMYSPPGESWEEHRDRLMRDFEYNLTKATNTARMVRDLPDEPGWAQFKTDLRAQAYSKMCANLEVYQSMTPHDRVVAKEYTKDNYPEYFALMKHRE